MSDGELWMGIATCVVVGLVMVGLGAWQIVTGSPRLLHGYHYAATPPESYPALARATGAGMVVSGVGCAAIVPAPGLPGWLSAAGVVLLVGGIVLMLAAIAHYNGSLVSLPTSPGSRGRATAIVLGVVAVLALAAAVVTGAQMVASGDPSALHSYHLVNVSSADRPALARWVGAATVGLGVGLAATLAGGACMSLRRPAPRWATALAAVGVVVFLASVLVMLGAISHFNGSLMG